MITEVDACPLTGDTPAKPREFKLRVDLAGACSMPHDVSSNSRPRFANVRTGTPRATRTIQRTTRKWNRSCFVRSRNMRPEC